MKSVHLIISGRVQGVGFRDWLTREANSRHLSGWVRNSGLETVEAVIAGPDGAVEECIQRCGRGSELARVVNIVVTEVPPPDRAGFLRRSSIPRLG